MNKIIKTESKVALPKLYPTAFHKSQVEKLLADNQQPYFTISPASVWHTKQYPPAKWIELINTLPAKSRVFLLGAGSDSALCETISTGSAHPNVKVICGQLHLLEIACLMQGARMNYTNDSAPLHIASAMDAPVTAVFCSTSPRFGFGPIGPKGQVVEEAVGLPCKPCGLHGYRKCPQGHFLCAKAIPISQLLNSTASL